MKKANARKRKAKALTKPRTKAPTKDGTAIRRVNPAGLYPPNGYAHVVEATRARTVYISGQVPMDAKGNVVGAGDFRAQVTQVFENLKTALAAADATFGDVVKANYYVLDMSNIAVLREVRATYWGTAAPASTLVEVKKLANEAFLIEIEVIAVCAR